MNEAVVVEMTAKFIVQRAKNAESLRPQSRAHGEACAARCADPFPYCPVHRRRGFRFPGAMDQAASARHCCLLEFPRSRACSRAHGAHRPARVAMATRRAAAQRNIALASRVWA